MRMGVASSADSAKRRLKRWWKIIESAEAAVIPIDVTRIALE